MLALGCVCGMMAASQVRAADPVPPPPPMPDHDTQTTPQTSPSQSNVKGACVNCAVIRSIRQVERERATPRQMPSYISSPEYRNSIGYGGPPLVGPVVGFSFGPGLSNQPVVGAAGSPAMRQRQLQISYEVVVRFDDGRFGLLELEDVSDFRVGDHVRLVDNHLELAPR